MLNALEPWHLLIIVGVLVVLFGAKRLPGSARSLGHSMRIFRSEMAQGKDGDETPAAPVAPQPAAVAAPMVAATAPAAPQPTPPVAV